MVPGIRCLTMQIWQFGRPARGHICKARVRKGGSGELPQSSWQKEGILVRSVFLLLAKCWLMMCGAAAARTVWIRRLARNTHWWAMPSAKGFIIHDVRIRTLHISQAYPQQTIAGQRMNWKRLVCRRNGKPDSSMQSTRWKSMIVWRSIHWIRRTRMPMQ